MNGNSFHCGGNGDSEWSTINRGSTDNGVAAIGGVVDSGIRMGGTDSDLVIAIERDGRRGICRKRKLGHLGYDSVQVRQDSNGLDAFATQCWRKSTGIFVGRSRGVWCTIGGHHWNATIKGIIDGCIVSGTSDADVAVGSLRDNGLLHRILKIKRGTNIVLCVNTDYTCHVSIARGASSLARLTHKRRMVSISNRQPFMINMTTVWIIIIISNTYSFNNQISGIVFRIGSNIKQAKGFQFIIIIHVWIVWYSNMDTNTVGVGGCTNLSVSQHISARDSLFDIIIT